MAFFDDAPSPPDPAERQVYPDWFKPPSRLLGVPLSTQAVIVNNGSFAVLATGFIAYPMGVQFGIELRSNGNHTTTDHRTIWDGPGQVRYGVLTSSGESVFPYLHDGNGHQPTDLMDRC